jgi:hypothetical protein
MAMKSPAAIWDVEYRAWKTFIFFPGAWRRRRFARLPAILLNIAFNLATAYLLFASMNAFVPFYAARTK